MKNYKPTASYKLIYVYRINDEKHKYYYVIEIERPLC